MWEKTVTGGNIPRRYHDPATNDMQRTNDACFPSNA
jgi:hypothetical protein